MGHTQAISQNLSHDPAQLQVDQTGVIHPWNQKETGYVLPLEVPNQT